MATLSVNNLEAQADLDRSAMRRIKGGVMPRYVVRDGKVVMLTCTEPTRPGDRPASGGSTPVFGTRSYF